MNNQPVYRYRLTRQVKLVLAAGVVGLGLMFAACGEPDATPLPSSAPSVGGFQALPNPTQAKQNQQRADELCPLCGMFPSNDK